MGNEYTEIDDRLHDWVRRQQIFFVATAPLSGDGLVNCSPKGLDSLRILGPTTVAYVDIGGSGIETVAHLKENGRIVIMLCAFEGPPKIVRFYGAGRVIEPHDDQFPKLLAEFPPQPSSRNIIEIAVNRIIDSCGYGVPMYEFQKDRESLANYYGTKSEEFIAGYRQTRNTSSLDGLPGLEFPDHNEVDQCRSDAVSPDVPTAIRKATTDTNV